MAEIVKGIQGRKIGLAGLLRIHFSLGCERIFLKLTTMTETRYYQSLLVIINILEGSQSGEDKINRNVAESGEEFLPSTSPPLYYPGNNYR